MIVAVGCDHAGYPLKERVVREIEKSGHTVHDCGAFDYEPLDDYPDFGRAVGLAVAKGQAQRGIVVCGSGVGISVACCKIPGVRAAMCHDTFSARQGVEDDDMNILCLGGRVIGPETAAECIHSFLGAVFSGAERHARRLEKVNQIERDARAGVFDQ